MAYNDLPLFLIVAKMALPWFCHIASYLESGQKSADILKVPS